MRHCTGRFPVWKISTSREIGNEKFGCELRAAQFDWEIIWKELQESELFVLETRACLKMASVGHRHASNCPVLLLYGIPRVRRACLRSFYNSWTSSSLFSIQVAVIFRRKNLTANESSKETNSNFGKTEIFVERIESKERRRENNVSTKLSKFPLQCTSSCRKGERKFQFNLSHKFLWKTITKKYFWFEIRLYPVFFVHTSQ